MERRNEYLNAAVDRLNQRNTVQQRPGAAAAPSVVRPDCGRSADTLCVGVFAWLLQTHHAPYDAVVSEGVV
ncbi:MAG: hypothetical protein ACREXR_18950, partial [Gammaproteobacteria bacterium]